MKSSPKRTYVTRQAKRRGNGYDYKISRAQYDFLRSDECGRMSNDEILAYLNASCGFLHPIVSFIVEG